MVINWFLDRAVLSPKIKMYISVNTKLEKKQDFEKIEMFLENEIDKIVKEINLWIRIIFLEFLDTLGSIKSILL